MKLAGASVLCLLALMTPVLARQDGALRQPAPGNPQEPAKPQTAAEAPKEAQEKPGDDGIFRWRGRPSFQFGRVFRIDFRVKLQNDFRSYSPELETESGTFEFHRRRVGIQGYILREIEYEVERDIKREFETFDTPDGVEETIAPVESGEEWRDVFVNVRYFPDVQVRAGKFKLPFSLDELTGSTNLDFIYRSRVADALAPARDIGVMAHGRFFRRGLGYEVGFFKHDGEGARTGTNAVAGRTGAVRVTGTPFRRLPIGPLKDIELGLATTVSDVPEGRTGLRGKTIAGNKFFPGQKVVGGIFVSGRRTRVGTELNWMPGPFSLKGEFIQVLDQRKNQGLANDDLPDLLARGWYLSATWAVTGDKKADGLDETKKPLFQGGFGAVELAVRAEQLRFGSRNPQGVAFRNPRAENILGNSDRAWTFGVNWYANRWVKIQANGIREKIEDLERSPILGRSRYWTRVLRLQFTM